MTPAPAPAPRLYVLGFAFAVPPDVAVSYWSDTDVQVVLIEKLRGPPWMRKKLNGLGGRVEDGEDAVAAMAREFVEEAGVRIDPDDWRCFGVMHGEEPEGAWRCALFAAFLPRGAEVASPTDEPVSLHPRVDLPAFRTLPNVYALVEAAWLALHQPKLGSQQGERVWLDLSYVRRDVAATLAEVCMVADQLTERVDAAAQRIARLEAVVAAEQGRAAPEGWSYDELLLSDPDSRPRNGWRWQAEGLMAEAWSHGWAVYSDDLGAFDEIVRCPIDRPMSNVLDSIEAATVAIREILAAHRPSVAT